MPQKIVIFLPYFHIIYIFLHVFVSAWRSVPAREKSMPSEWKASSTHHVVLFHGENTVSMLWMWIWICPLNLLTISLDRFSNLSGIPFSFLLAELWHFTSPQVFEWHKPVCNNSHPDGEAVFRGSSMAAFSPPLLFILDTDGIVGSFYTVSATQHFLTNKKRGRISVDYRWPWWVFGLIQNVFFVCIHSDFCTQSPSSLTLRHTGFL